jgi:hypothetical protein
MTSYTQRWRGLGVVRTAVMAVLTLIVTTASGQPTPRAVNLQYGTPLSSVLPAFNDAMDEPNESFTVVIASPDNSAAVGPPPSAVLVDDDAPGANIEIDFTTAQESIGEAAGSVPISIRIITPNGAPTSAPVFLNLWTVQGSAIANVDYQQVASGVPVNTGTVSGTVVTSSLLIGNDTIDEPVETFTVNISTALPGVSAIPTQTVSIIGNDPGPFGLAAGGQGGEEPQTERTETSEVLLKAPKTVTWKTVQPLPPLKQLLNWTMGSPDEGASNDASRQKETR